MVEQFHKEFSTFHMSAPPVNMSVDDSIVLDVATHEVFSALDNNEARRDLWKGCYIGARFEKRRMEIHRRLAPILKFS